MIGREGDPFHTASPGPFRSQPLEAAQSFGDGDEARGKRIDSVCPVAWRWRDRSGLRRCEKCWPEGAGQHGRVSSYEQRR